MNNRPSASKSSKRVRASESESAVSAVLRAMAANGIAVGKICISGGQVEIIAASVENADIDQEDERLEKW